MRRLTVAIAAVLTVLSLAAGCFALIDLMAMDSHDRVIQVDDVQSVRIENQGNGTIQVIGYDRAEVRMDFHWRDGLTDADIETSVTDGELLIRTQCPKAFNFTCEVGATVHVPMGTPVVGIGEGRIEVTGVGGDVDMDVTDGSAQVDGAKGNVAIDTADGSIVVADSTGSFDLSSRDGSIETERLDARRITTSGIDGDIQIDLVSAPTLIQASTRDGSVTVLLPADAPAYAVQASAKDGRVTNTTRTDPTSDHTLVADTVDGSVTIRYRE